MRNVLVLCLVSLAAAFPSAPSGPMSNKRAAGLVAKALNNVTEDLLQAAREVHGCNENLVFSPLSISVALAMLLEGSDGRTREQLVNALHLARGLNENGVREGFRELLQSLSAQGNDVSYILDIASGIFVQDNITLKPEFHFTLANKYFADIENKDFQGNALGVEQDLNSWVAEKTRNEIPQFLSPGSLSPRTVMYLLNAVYFSGQWETQFPVQDTNLMTFSKTETDKVEVEMMHAEADYRAAPIPELQADAVEIPYEGQRMTMLVIVPHQVNGLKDLEKKVSSKLVEEILYRKIVHRPVQLSMPKLNIEADLKLKEVMMKLGVQDVFQSYANLSKISPDYEQGLFVDDAKHKAVLKVDEYGTKAAAVTGIGIVPLSGFWEPPQDMVITIDRPFMFYIYDWDARIVVFTGSVSNPNGVNTPDVHPPQTEDPFWQTQEQVVPQQPEQVPEAGQHEPESDEQESEPDQQQEVPLHPNIGLIQGGSQQSEQDYDSEELIDITPLSGDLDYDSYEDFQQNNVRNPFNPFGQAPFNSFGPNPFNPFATLPRQRFGEETPVKPAASNYDKIVFLGGPLYHEYMDVK